MVRIGARSAAPRRAANPAPVPVEPSGRPTRRHLLASGLSLAGFALAGCHSENEPRTVSTTDICVYGGSSSGVLAAVAAARMGKRIVLIAPSGHVGGMTSNGAPGPSVPSAVGGLARELYVRIGSHYGQPAGTPAPVFEPHIAEQVFDDLLANAGVILVRGQQIVAVTLEDGRLRDIVTTDGSRFGASIYIDASYAGDLMAAAGVSYIFGRESRGTYNEPLAGIQPPPETREAGAFLVPVDPFVTPGQPAGGLLPYLLSGEPYDTLGSADKRVQAYSYRLCLTSRPDNRVAFQPPADYDASRYELLGRWIAARVAAGDEISVRDLLGLESLPNGKYLAAGAGPISPDFVGGSDGYPEGDAAARSRIAQAHESYLRGFLTFLASDERVPATARQEMNSLGLAADEFTANQSWPYELHIPEARRMVSSFVMTQDHCQGRQTAPRAIAVGSGPIALHAVRRIVNEGRPMNEGGIGGPVVAPYAIAYDAIIPKPEECLNLLVPACLSASHVAYGSIRKEPVLMALGQAAGAAASLALDANVSVQEVDYARLRQILEGSGLAL